MSKSSVLINAYMHSPATRSSGLLKPQINESLRRADESQAATTKRFRDVFGIHIDLSEEIREPDSCVGTPCGADCCHQCCDCVTSLVTPDLAGPLGCDVVGAAGSINSSESE